MKLAVITGWILLALEGLFVAVLFVSKNMGDDAAGRGMARGFAVILGPILLVAAALFIWGQRGGPRPAFWAGFGIMAIPLVFFLVTSAKKTLRGFDLAAGKALYGKFDDRRLTRLARAIEKNDTATVRSIIAEGPIDFTARSKRGRTILGRAIEHASGAYDAPEAVASVRMLLEAGGKPLPNLIEPEFSQGDLDAHLLVAYVFGGNSPNTLPLLDLVLGAGADPNMRNYEGQPLYFSSYLTLPKLEMLAKHGADFTALETTRDDRRGWTGAMYAVEIQEYHVALFLLDHGVAADHAGADGSTLRSLVAAKVAEGEQGEPGSAFETLRARLGVAADSGSTAR